jgi:hypothetical protein
MTGRHVDRVRATTSSSAPARPAARSPEEGAWIDAPLDPAELRLLALLVAVPLLAATELGEIGVNLLQDPRLRAAGLRLVSFTRDGFRVSPYAVARALLESPVWLRLPICELALEIDTGPFPDLTLIEAIGTLGRSILDVRRRPLFGGAA